MVVYQCYRIMEKKEILDRLDAVIASSVNHHDFVLMDETKPADIQGWDSLANAMIITAIQQEFGVKFKFAELVVWKTIGQLADLIAKKLV